MVVASGNHTTGSWHNSGYYGHYRSRIRNDFMNEYRQRAKPQPPQTYLDRSMAPVRKHAFSKHDSRERYKDNALYFVDGNGRRQVHSSTAHYKPEFIAWMPHKAELIDKRQPLTSVYRETFHNGVRSSSGTIDPHRQLYSNRIASQAPSIRHKLDAKEIQGVFSDGYPTDIKTHFTTTYRKIHCTPDPRREEAREINTICYQSANSQKIERAHSVGPSQIRESVAGCLSWAVQRPQTTVPPREDRMDCHRIGNRGLKATPLIPAATVADPAPSVPNGAPSTAALVC